MELDPVWSPGVPELLLKPGWVLAIGSSPQGAGVKILGDGSYGQLTMKNRDLTTIPK